MVLVVRGDTKRVCEDLGAWDVGEVVEGDDITWA